MFVVDSFGVGLAPPWHRRRRLATGALLALLALVAGLGTPAPAGAQNVLLTTPYPAISVEPGGTATFDLVVRADQPVRVDLAVEDLPEGWTATMRGGGREVTSVFADPETPPELSLDLDVPEDAEAGDSTVTVVATAGEEASRLALEISVVTAATGSTALTTDVPARAAAADETFDYTLDLENDTPQQLTFELQATGPRGWTVSVEPAGEADATSVTVDARGSQTLNVTATPPPQASEGDYPLRVEALAGEHSIGIDLLARVTGRVEMEFTTSDQRLNATATAGSPTQVEMVVTNTGTAALGGLTLSGTGPSEWEVTFEPAEVEQVAPNGSAPATAVITPSEDAVAGDYVVTLTATGEGVEQSVDIRVTVETSPLWGAVGLALIVLTLGGMVWVFRRYGRR